jgi:hypothetical protein
MWLWDDDDDDVCFILEQHADINDTYVISEYCRAYNKSNITVVTGGAGTAYPSGAHEFTHGFWWGSCYSIFSFMCNAL